MSTQKEKVVIGNLYGSTRVMSFRDRRSGKDFYQVYCLTCKRNQIQCAETITKFDSCWVCQQRLPRRLTTMLEHIVRNVKVDSAGCWNWQKARTGKPAAGWRGGGYGEVGFTENGKTIIKYSHRLSYETFVGPIAPGLEIHHKCRNTACCNPVHLQVVTRSLHCQIGVERRKAAKEAEAKD